LPRDADVHRLRRDRLFVDLDDHVMPRMGPHYTSKICPTAPAIRRLNRSMCDDTHRCTEPRLAFRGLRRTPGRPWQAAQRFAAAHESADGPFRPFAAAQRYVRSWPVSTVRCDAEKSPVLRVMRKSASRARNDVIDPSLPFAALDFAAHTGAHPVSPAARPHNFALCLANLTATRHTGLTALQNNKVCHCRAACPPRCSFRFICHSRNSW
jgi:hypothetical protein